MSNADPRTPSAEQPTRWWTLTPQRATAQAADAWRFPAVDDALTWLHALGLCAGERLAVSAAPSPSTVAILQAARLAGVTLVLINRRLPPTERRTLAERSGARVVLVSDEQPIPPDFTVIPKHFPSAAAIAAAPLRPADAALVLFTSGTTGTPKAARLTAAALDTSAAAAVAALNLTREDHWLGCLPMDHIGGASVVFRAARCGYRLTVVERFDAGLIDRLLDELDVTGISVVPTMLHRLCAVRGARPWPMRLRCILTGGGPLDAALHARCTALGVSPCQTYGLTETGSMLCTQSPDDAGALHAGRPVSGAQVRIRRDDGELAASDEDGVIEVIGPMLFAGYEHDAGLDPARTPDGWFATGDLGQLDAAGNLTVYCRRTDLILSGGENIYPAQVEAVLARCPGCAAVAVCGLADVAWGQVVAAAVVPLPDFSRDEFEGWVHSELPGPQRPRRVALVRALPMTANGKLQRQMLPDLFRSSSLA